VATTRRRDAKKRIVNTKRPFREEESNGTKASKIPQTAGRFNTSRGGRGTLAWMRLGERREKGWNEKNLVILRTLAKPGLRTIRGPVPEKTIIQRRKGLEEAAHESGEKGTKRIPGHGKGHHQSTAALLELHPEPRDGPGENEKK